MMSESTENLGVIRGGVSSEATETSLSSAVSVWPIPACLIPNRGRPHNDTLLGLSVCRCLGDRGDYRAERTGVVSGTHVYEATPTLSVTRKKKWPAGKSSQRVVLLGFRLHAQRWTGHVDAAGFNVAGKATHETGIGAGCDNQVVPGVVAVQVEVY